ncbi:MAG: DASS family sodium-coupled anion symporter [Gammaproteobacteria bacterium]|nr:DASS family sodium-coupled anion symporter [Gammaproteobacteria bacterium]
MADPKPKTYRPAQRFGLFLGLALFVVVLILPPPDGLSIEGWRTAAVALLMATWWMTEAIPIEATGLLPLGLFPALGVLDAPTTSAPYANELIFLFMGGFFLAVTMQRWGLHKRIALAIVAKVGTSPNRLVLGFMLATASLSMWISNTATVAMMLPIGIAVAEMFKPQDQQGRYEFGIALMLGIAYGASAGGVSTLIGTPPNAVLAGAANELLDVQIGFVQWMGIGLPMTCVLLPLIYFVLTRVLYPPGKLVGDAASILQAERDGLGKMSRGEKSIATVFALTALAWVFRSEKTFGDVTIPGIQTVFPNISDSTIAMTAVIALFVLPVDWRKGDFTLNWRTARTIPWGVLVLFGGGLSLARAMEDSGLAAWIGGAVGSLEAVPMIVIIAAVTALIVFLTELTSNVATTSMAMPVMAGAAVGLGIEPLMMMAAAALAASMAFMLPVATPPNAIVFGSGYLTVPQMSRAGLVLNLIAIVAITTIGSLLVPYFLID